MRTLLIWHLQLPCRAVSLQQRMQQRIMLLQQWQRATVSLLSPTCGLIALLHAVTLLTKDVKCVPDHSERSFYKELVKVIEASDVILEVLDARDPLGTRCIDMEKMVRKADPSKRIVLLLNKIGIMQCLLCLKFALMVVMPSYISTYDS